MMRTLEPKVPSLFAYNVSLERRVPADHPLREIKRVLDLSFVAPAVKHTYGRSGNPSVPPEVIVRMLFLLFYYDVPSERELSEQIGLRLDFLWFLDLDLESAVPNHSVLSKARARWGTKIFEQLFTRTVSQCVQAGLVDGRLLHVDSTIVAANASKDSVLSGGAELVSALRQAYAQQEQKLALVPEPTAEATAAAVAATVTAAPPVAPVLPVIPPAATAEPAEPVARAPKRERGEVNATHVSPTDPDAHLARDKSGVTRLAYKDHRLVDDARGVITAVVSSTATVADGTQLSPLYAQHQANTGLNPDRVTMAGDKHYGTADNFRYCRETGLGAHLGIAANGVAGRGLFTLDKFVYAAAQDRFLCPGGHPLVLHQRRPELNVNVYLIERAEHCRSCPLQAQCTRGKNGRSLQVAVDYALLQADWAQARTPAAQHSRRRRQHVMEGSFADAANNHGSKRARWRRQWRQQIQSWLIAAVQNLRLLIKHGGKNRASDGAVGLQRQVGRTVWLQKLLPQTLSAMCLTAYKPWTRIAAW
jgi:transposase